MSYLRNLKMTNDEIKQLEKIKQSGFVKADLKYTDLILLLKYDEDTRFLIRNILNNNIELPQTDNIRIENTESVESIESIKINNFFPIKKETSLSTNNNNNNLSKSKTKLEDELSNELILLEYIKNDDILNKEFIKTDLDSGQQLISLIVNLSNIENIINVWNSLATKCKSEKRAANSSELFILNEILRLYNMRWNNQSAKLIHSEINIDFHHEKAIRGTSKGGTIITEWLPGICNAAGKIEKLPLVETN